MHAAKQNHNQRYCRRSWSSKISFLFALSQFSCFRTGLKDALLEPIRQLLKIQQGQSIYEMIGSIGETIRYTRENRYKIRVVVTMTDQNFILDSYQILSNHIDAIGLSLSPVYRSAVLTIFLDMLLHSQFNNEDNPHRLSMCLVDLIARLAEQPQLSDFSLDHPIEPEQPLLLWSDTTSAKNRLKKAYLQLAAISDQNTIRVAKVAETAGVSCVTFYDNFKNLNDLRKIMEAEAIQLVAKLLKQTDSSQDSIIQTTTKIFTYLWNNRETIWLIRTIPAGTYFEQFHDVIYPFYSNQTERQNIFHKNFTLFAIESLLLNTTTSILPHPQIKKEALSTHLAKLISILLHL